MERIETLKELIEFLKKYGLQAEPYYTYGEVYVKGERESARVKVPVSIVEQCETDWIAKNFSCSASLVDAWEFIVALKGEIEPVDARRSYVSCGPDTLEVVEQKWKLKPGTIAYAEIGAWCEPDRCHGQRVLYVCPEKA